MTSEKQSEVFKELTGSMIKVMQSKANDYADTDVLSNFKKVAFICNITPEQVLLTLIATKTARLGILLQGTKPNNESIEDSILDLANYSVLLYMIRNDTI